MLGHMCSREQEQAISNYLVFKAINFLLPIPKMVHSRPVRSKRSYATLVPCLGHSHPSRKKMLSTHAQRGRLSQSIQDICVDTETFLR